MKEQEFTTSIKVLRIDITTFKNEEDYFYVQKDGFFIPLPCNGQISFYDIHKQYHVYNWEAVIKFTVSESTYGGHQS